MSGHRREVLIAAPGKPRRRKLTIMNALGDFRRLIAIRSDSGLAVRAGFEGQTRGLAGIIPVPCRPMPVQRVSIRSWSRPSLRRGPARRCTTAGTVAGTVPSPHMIPAMARESFVHGQPWADALGKAAFCQIFTRHRRLRLRRYARATRSGIGR